MIRLHMPRRLFTRAALLGAALALAGGTALAGAGAASATPLHPEFFTISFPAATGTAYGPVHGAFTDNEVSSTSGIWTFDHTGAVRVDHTAVGTPTINPRSCTGFLYQQGNWQMNGLYGADRNAFGFGKFQLREFVQVARDYGRHNRPGRCDPNKVLTETVYVTGSGLAANH